MKMQLLDKLQRLAIGLLPAFMAALAFAAPATSSAGTAALPGAGFGSALGEATPEHGPVCFGRHDPCKSSGIATAPSGSATAHAIPSGTLVKTHALQSAPIRDVGPHTAVSLAILFRRFRK